MFLIYGMCIFLFLECLLIVEVICLIEVKSIIGCGWYEDYDSDFSLYILEL